MAVSLVGLRAYLISRGLRPPWVIQKTSFSKSLMCVASLRRFVSVTIVGKRTSSCPVASCNFLRRSVTCLRILYP